MLRQESLQPFLFGCLLTETYKQVSLPFGRLLAPARAGSTGSQSIKLGYWSHLAILIRAVSICDDLRDRSTGSDVVCQIRRDEQR